MADSRLGTYLVQHRYRIDPGDRERFDRVISVIRAHQLDLGVATFEVWQDAQDPSFFVETVGYDSWSHCRRLESASVPPPVQEAIEAFGMMVIGSWDGVESHSWDPCDL
jgi:hypothetical protein